MTNRSPPLQRLLLLAIALIPPATGHAQILYEAALGTRPDQQGWLYVTTPLFGSEAKETFSNGATLLDTTPQRTDKAGYFSNLFPFGGHPSNPVLDRHVGFYVSFSLRLLAEEHVSEDRAGFSVIVTASDLAALELGFWPGEIWAQSGADFIHAESASIDTTDVVPHRFDLTFRDDHYALSIDGAALLAGPLRRYDGFGAPYTIPNFLFFGDDTSSASARSELRVIRVEPLPTLRVKSGTVEEEIVVEVTAEAGRDVTLETTAGSDLWNELGTKPNPNGTIEFHETVTESRTVRLFRARVR